MIKKMLFVAMIAATAAGVAVPASAVEVIILTAPPPLRVEHVPPPRHGYVWVPGYWNAHGHKYAWTKGTWMRERHGYRYNTPTWVEHNGQWTMNRGAWARNDRDGDGVPNKVDSQPDNPRRN
ncbi:MAG: YXWGXW repeat-containing protein [Betaproteobacteria bacterium]